MSSYSGLATRRTLNSAGIESGPRTVETGTIGTPALISMRMNPVRPASTAVLAPANLVRG